MKEQDRNKAWGFTLFADDLRTEVGGKQSIMGLYQADMLLPNNLAFPVNLAKFCLLVMYYESGDSIDGDVVFKVTFASNENPLVELAIPRKDLIGPLVSEPSPADLLPEDTDRILHSRIPIVISPFTIVGVGRLRVRAHYSDGSVAKLGSIAVRQIALEEINKALGGSDRSNSSQ